MQCSTGPPPLAQRSRTCTFTTLELAVHHAVRHIKQHRAALSPCCLPPPLLLLHAAQPPPLRLATAAAATCAHAVRLHLYHQHIRTRPLHGAGTPHQCTMHARTPQQCAVHACMHAHQTTQHSLLVPYIIPSVHLHGLNIGHWRMARHAERLHACRCAQRALCRQVHPLLCAARLHQQLHACAPHPMSRQAPMAPHCVCMHVAVIGALWHPLLCV